MPGFGEEIFVSAGTDSSVSDKDLQAIANKFVSFGLTSSVDRISFYRDEYFKEYFARANRYNSSPKPRSFFYRDSNGLVAQAVFFGNQTSEKFEFSRGPHPDEYWDFRLKVFRPFDNEKQEQD